ncbi:MAG: heavy metal translocating P-type ATPase [Pseudomonadales bacterium]|nr:heavy metal translocating P-type ATPase [Pseudomonadales bacterium]
MSQCYHCGLDTTSNTPYHHEIDGSERIFCCPGCQAVALTIHENGLQDYYKLRSANASPLLKRQPADYELYNEPLLQAEFIKKNTASNWEAEIFIEDLHCAACCWLIEKAVTRQKGIEDIQVNLSTHKALVKFDPEHCKAADIFSAISKLGYQAVPASGNTPQKHLQHQRKEDLKRLGLAGLIMMQTGMFSIALYAGEFQGIAYSHQTLIRVFSLILSTIMLAYCAKPFFQGALRNLKNKALGMDTPISIALSGAWVSSAYATMSGNGHVYFDSIAMFTFLLLLARYIESGSRNHPSYWHFRPDIPANCKHLDQQGKIMIVPVASLKAGQIILINPGETIVADGEIIEGCSSVDDSSISGEFLPKRKSANDPVYAGSINHDGTLKVRVSRASGDSSLSVINRLTERAMLEKPEIAGFAETVASLFTLIVLSSTGLCGFLWWYFNPEKPAQEIFEICFSMLIASCPCALSLATPAALAFTHNSFRAKGVFIVTNNVIEKLVTISRAMFDKTGTLTEGSFRIAEIQTLGSRNKNQCIAIATTIESVSDHPVSGAFRQAQASGRKVNHAPDSFCLFSGEGIEAEIKDTAYRMGSLPFCQEWQPDLGMKVMTGAAHYQRIWLVSKEECLACFCLEDSIRSDAADLVSYFSRQKLTTEIMSGDSSSHVEFVAGKLHIDNFHTGMTASQKLKMIKDRQKKGESVLMIGDGINDAPVLAAANVSIAMGNASDISKNSADILLCSNRLSDIKTLLIQSRKTLRIIKQNIGWALFYNCSILPMAGLGLVPPWLAAIGMSLSSLGVIINARRLKLPLELSTVHG